MSAPDTLTRLGRYQLTQVLGQGAMGLVYAATDPLLSRQVAIKTILRGQLLDPDVAADSSARFVREAQAVARLSHPHIVTVFDFGEEGDIAYIVMEFIRGRELKSYFDEGQFFDQPEALRIMTELLEALDYAHGQGVVHRDVKPANVMLDTAGRVKLTDFGVARLADSNLERTLAGTMVGTPSYMSPEQIQGLAVGSRADLFAAGIILYQFLTRSKPFPGPGQWTIQKQIVSDDPVPPSFADRRVPPVFDGIIARALAKDPAQRYESAAAFAADLRRAAPAQAPAAAAPGLAAAARADEAITLRAEDRTVRIEAAAEKLAVTSGEETTVRETPQPAAAGKTGRAARFGLGAGLALAVAAGAVYLAEFRHQAQESAPLPAAVPAPASVSEKAPATILPQQGTAAGAAAKPDAAGAEAAAAPAAAQNTALAPPAPKPAVAHKTQAFVARAAAGARCDDLLQRFQLGEALSPQDLAVIQKECKK